MNRSVFFLFLFVSFNASANEKALRIAVASNFINAFQTLAKSFTQKTGIPIESSSASTGKLVSQILSNAPFDVFLSADQEQVKNLVERKKANDDSRFTYARGRLALWSRDPQKIKKNGKNELDFKKIIFKKIAIANPTLAPYGLAAEQTLRKLGKWDRMQKQIVQGENIAQAFEFVHSGNAEIGFIAASQIPSPFYGSKWDVPSRLHEPIVQDAVILAQNAHPQEAKKWMEYLKSETAKNILKNSGYD